MSLNNTFPQNQPAGKQGQTDEKKGDTWWGQLRSGGGAGVLFGPFLADRRCQAEFDNVSYLFAVTSWPPHCIGLYDRLVLLAQLAQFTRLHLRLEMYLGIVFSCK